MKLTYARIRRSIVEAECPECGDPSTTEISCFDLNEEEGHVVHFFCKEHGEWASRMKFKVEFSDIPSEEAQEPKIDKVKIILR